MLINEKSTTEAGASDDLQHLNEQRGDPILSDDAREVLEIVFFVVLNGPINLLGSVVNVVNIIIFIKQGCSDPVNISLCALSVSDLGSLLTMAWTGICFVPLFQYSDIGFDSTEVHLLTGGLPHSCFVRITGLITAFITFERCVCIALPMKVKNIITPKRTLISILAMSAIVFAITGPLFSSMYLAPLFHAKRNKTLVSLLYTSNAVTLEIVSLSSTIFVQVSCFIIVVICTIILVVKLLARSHWRNKATSVSDVSDSISTRDKRVMKIVTHISLIFIICYFPNVINLMLVAHLSPEYSATGRYVNSFNVSWAIINTIEGINSSVTILVYYNMSSKFRATFKQLFHTFFRKHSDMH